MGRRSSAVLTGTAGEHFVAYKLSCLGFVAALPRSGATGVDVLASSQDGARTIAIQVKTTEWAMRTRGRGDGKRPHHLEFPLGHKAASLNNDGLLFAFVDLRGRDFNGLEPDVYVVPSTFLFRFCKSWKDQVKLVRFHVDIHLLEPFKNNWGPVIDELAPRGEAAE